MESVVGPVYRAGIRADAAMAILTILPLVDNTAATLQIGLQAFSTT